MAVFYKVYQNNNKKNPNRGKWYGRACMVGTLTTDDIAERVQTKCALHKADVVACLQALLEEIQLGLNNSMKVKLDNLGTFKIGISSQCVDERKMFKADKIYSKRVIFTPEKHRDVTTGIVTRALTDGVRFKEWGGDTESDSGAAGGSTSDSGSSSSSSGSDSGSQSGSGNNAKANTAGDSGSANL